MPYKHIGVLSTIIFTTLGKSDPVSYIQNRLAYNSRLYCRNKLISCVAKSEGMDSSGAIDYFKGLLSTRSL